MNETTTNADYLEYVGATTGEGELTTLSNLAEEQAKAALAVADLEKQLEKAKEVYKDLAERQVPELMDSIGIQEFKTKSGLKIKIQETIRASISVANQERAFAWLRAGGYGALIKRNVSVQFGKGQDEAAGLLIEELEAKSLSVDDKSSVHPSTLSSFVKEKLTAGEEMPTDLLGVVRLRVSKLG